MPFGKHQGELIADVPADYAAWLLRQPDVDEYLTIALRRRLGL
jgi:exodeoxyribonuclease X